MTLWTLYINLILKKILLSNLYFSDVFDALKFLFPWNMHRIISLVASRHHFLSFYQCYHKPPFIMHCEKIFTLTTAILLDRFRTFVKSSNLLPLFKYAKYADDDGTMACGSAFKPELSLWFEKNQPLYDSLISSDDIVLECFTSLKVGSSSAWFSGNLGWKLYRQSFQQVCVVVKSDQTAEECPCLSSRVTQRVWVLSLNSIVLWRLTVVLRTMLTCKVLSFLKSVLIFNCRTLKLHRMHQQWP